jgi:hypothetical protein
MPETPGPDVQITVDATQALAKLDEVQQVLHVGFFAYIRRLGVRHCGVCGKRRVCYAIEVTGTTAGFVPSDQQAQLVGTPKCAQHSGIR